MGFVEFEGCNLYYEDAGEGVPILLIHPSGANASTWGPALDDLASIGRAIANDRRGYSRSSSSVVRSMPRHTADAAAILDHLRTGPAVVVGTSAGAMIALDLAVRRPDVVRAVVAHEAPWRFNRHLPEASRAAALVKIASLMLRGRQSDAVEVLLRVAYTYRNGGSAWDAFPEEWRSVARENAGPALADFRMSVGNFPSAADLACVSAPVVCSHGTRSPESMVRFARTLADVIPTARTYRIEGAGHAAPFDARSNFLQLVADASTHALSHWRPI